MNSEYLKELEKLVLPSVYETLYMVFWASLIAIVLGLIFGIILYITDKENILENLVINNILGIIINIGRSVPFVILMIAVFPLSKFIVGTSIGTKAAVVPLTIAAIPFVARMIESALKEIDKGVIEASVSMGSNEWQIIYKVLLPESISSIISVITTTIISIIGYSSMAGVIGGGGLGNIAIIYGYQRYRTDILIISVLIMIVLVQIVQGIGNILCKKLNKK